ncbi:MAG: hypothetical protein COZ74_12285 [Flavobacteriaceae bacterium CG_4_8_14_3_um_filter_31_8]|nr:MAG: hypothetical protein AUK46_08045 [Flavobacteriaceae bacterium CG2_30_31_66]PIV96231.1 MAG: hypothetical protein COW43_09385 [Flavobacteriaceae bacterium CG17_big_fil_post_rev_8_21_14_2_50_31_13]PIX12098.1 MAG: hypothetical protein COZ74_12285 [Flavobacteriaceae bacterium CG_4_8_14_3_um_filter_31_8]PJC09316.1 MAG: hypothetical protein CO067_10450 [Flavobacteriaceae bacterium CG_4_9_14_0_8_um_filter_31_91]
MENYKLLLPIILYTILITIYLYSIGRFNVKKEKDYKLWVKQKGKKLSKAIIIIGIIYTILLVLQLLG